MERKIRGEVTFRILDVIQSGLGDFEKIIDAMTSDYATSYKKLAKITQRGTEQSDLLWSGQLREIKKFRALLFHLKKQGIIEIKRGQKGDNTIITKKGKIWIQNYQLFSKRTPKRYKKENKKNGIYVVAFDIPEREKRKRAWIRDALRMLDFKLLQGSVWIGKAGISGEFLEDLRILKMINYVHVFEIKNEGSLSVLLEG